MTLLLDTHIFLWAVLEPQRLSSRVRELLENPDHTLWVSVVSAFEITTKYRLGKLPHAASVVENYNFAVQELGASELPLRASHALYAGMHASPHRDPFDRLLAAQATIEQMPLVSADPAMRTFALDDLIFFRTYAERLFYSLPLDGGGRGRGW